MAPLPSYEEMLDMFNAVDTNKTGALSASELQKVLDNGSFRPFNIKAVRALIRHADNNGSGTITFEEFGELLKTISEWSDCFDSFDKDSSGNLDRKELKTAMQKLGFNCSSLDVANYLDNYDRTGSGFLNFDDFIEICVEVANRL